jgi:hypothetical protein
MWSMKENRVSLTMSSYSGVSKPTSLGMTAVAAPTIVIIVADEVNHALLAL